MAYSLSLTLATNYSSWDCWLIIFEYPIRSMPLLSLISLVSLSSLTSTGRGELTLTVTASSIFNLQHAASEHYVATSHIHFPQSQKFEASGVKERSSYWRFVPVDAGQRVVKCGMEVRLQHVDTGRFLVASNQPSIMSRNRLVSTISTKNVSDQAWLLECHGQKLVEKLEFSLLHIGTNKYLKMSQYFPYAYSKYWPDCSITGRLQVCVIGATGPQTVFKIEYGYFLVEDEIEEQKAKQPKEKRNDQDL